VGANQPQNLIDGTDTVYQKIIRPYSARVPHTHRTAALGQLANTFVLWKSLLISLGQKFIFLLQRLASLVRAHVKDVIEILLLCLDV
jgi:hypothetical protein